MQTDAPYATRLFGEPITLLRAANGDLTCRCRPGQGEAPVEYVVRSHQDLIWIWRGAPTTADERLLPTHPTPEATHSVETILDYGCDWKYIVENNLVRQVPAPNRSPDPNRSEPIRSDPIRSSQMSQMERPVTTHAGPFPPPIDAHARCARAHTTHLRGLLFNTGHAALVLAA